VRAALGAGRRRIAGELLVEGGVLALVGGALGLLFAFWGVDLLASLRPASLPIALDDIRLDGTVMAYAAGLAMLAGVIAGLAPALDLWRWQPAEVMRRGSSTTVARGAGRIARQGLLIGEVALSLMLLIGAGLLVHALVRLQRADVGYDPEGLVVVPLSVAVGASPDEIQLADLYEQLQDVARSSGAFEAATLASNAPGHDLMLTGRLAFEATGEVDERVQAPLTFTAPGYFTTLRIPILEGRDFNGSDVGAAETPVIVNRTFAERYLAGSPAIGQVLRWGQRDSSTRYRIVGVVGDALQYDPLQPEVDLQIYRPLWSLNLRPSAVGAAPRPMRLRLLVRVDPASTAPLEPLPERLRPLGAELDIGAQYALRDSLSAALDGPRFNAILFAAFAAIAIGLAAVGLYGVVSHAVHRRAREMGIRIAIGARAADVRRLVLRQGMVPVIVGVLLGLAGAAAAGRVIAGILYLVEPRDPLVFALVPLLLVLLALAAIWRLVLRATRVDPVTVLRAE
jgi:predicted permease